MKKLWIFFACLVLFSLASANVEAQETYYGDKVWTITFNMDVDPQTVNKNNIFIKDASGQTLHNVSVYLNPTTNQVYVDTIDDYVPGTYTLHVSDQVKSTSGRYLKDSTTKTFTIKSYKPITILEKSNSWSEYFLKSLLQQKWDWEDIKDPRGAYYLGENIYVVTTGMKPSGGYKIGINKIEQVGDQTILDLKDIGLSPGMIGHATINYPFIMIENNGPTNSKLSFSIDGESVPINDIPNASSNPNIYYNNQNLTIHFDMELNPETVNKDNIFIKNANGQTVENVQFTLNQTNTTVRINAVDHYSPGKYTLHISDQVKSKHGNHLKMSITENFIIDSYGPITIIEQSQLNNTQKELVENWRILMDSTNWKDIKDSRGAYYLDEDLYIVTTGMKPSGGYHILVNDIETDADKTSVYLKDVAPKIWVPVPAIIDHPFIIIKSTVPPNALSFFIDGDVMPIKKTSLSEPSIDQKDQAFAITFDTELDPTTVNKDNLFIKKVNGQTVDHVQFTLDKTNTTIYVDALDDYLPGAYTLHISDQVKSKSGGHLITPITEHFTIKSYGPITILEELELDNELLKNLRRYFYQENNNLTDRKEDQKNSKGAYYLGDDLYIITTGPKPTGGYNIMIDRIETNSDRTSVYFKDVAPAPGAAVTTAIDYPFVIIKSAAPPSTLSFFIDGDNMPIKEVPLANPNIYQYNQALIIAFDMELDSTTVNKDNLFIKDASGQTINNVQFTLDKTNKQVYINNLYNYLPGAYTLHISDQVKSKLGKRLKASITENFTVEPYEPITILERSQLNDTKKEMLQNFERHLQQQTGNWGNIKNSKGAYYLGDDIYVVTTGIKPTGGYTIGVNKVEKNGDQIIVDLKDIGLPPGMVGPAVIDYPVIIIKNNLSSTKQLSFLIDGDTVPIKY